MKNLFVIGAQRSGTTYLYHLLNEHPEIQMAEPVRPEPKFFMDDLEYTKGRAFYEEKYFGDRQHSTLYLGEKSTSYIERADVAERISSFYPDARILIILRDPVQRAYSNYRFSINNGIEDLSFTEAIEQEPERLTNSVFSTSVNPFAYRRRGEYINYIEPYSNFFGKEHLYILIFEELTGKLPAIQNLYEWLGVDSSYTPKSLHKIANAGTQEKNIIPSSVLKELANHYEASLLDLERYLGRKVQQWRTAWKDI
jgi:hypothetical protein